MNQELDGLIGCILGLLFALIMGSVVASSFYYNGICFESILLLVGWICVTGVLWLFPFVMQRIGWSKKLYVDERDLLILKNAALSASGRRNLRKF